MIELIWSVVPFSIGIALSTLVILGLGLIISDERLGMPSLLLSLDKNAISEGADQGLLFLAGLCIGLPFLLTVNQFFGLLSFTPTLAIAILFLLATNQGQRMRKIPFSLLIFVMANVLVFVSTYNILGNWLSEGINHDLILYTRGGDWVMHNGTLAPDSIVSTKYSTGRQIEACAEWIGRDCALHRGGAHTLVGLANLSIGSITPAQVYAAITPMSMFVFVGMRLHIEGQDWIKSGLTIAIALPLSLSAAMLSAVQNGNLATAAAIPLLITAALTLSAPIARQRPQLTAVTLAAITGTLAHIYSEAMWICGAITAVHITISAFDKDPQTSVYRFFRISVLAISVWLLTGNIGIIMAFTALLTVGGELSRELNWPNYFLEVENWRWLSMPFSSFLLFQNENYPAWLGTAGTLIIATVAWLYSDRIRLLAPLVFTVVAVIAIEWTSYEYGVHKIAQLFGGMVVAVGSVIIARLMMHGSKDRKFAIAGFSVASFIAIVQVHSVANYTQRIDQHVASLTRSKTIPLSDVPGLSRIHRNETVLVNDMSWTGWDRFSKTNWSVFKIENEGARAVMGPFKPESIRGGYENRDLRDTLAWADRVDWILQSGSLTSPTSIITYGGSATWRSGSFELIDLRDTRAPAVFQGTGWLDREPNLQWTDGRVSLHVLAPDSKVRWELKLKFTTFAPPENQHISILRDGVLVSQAPATAAELSLAIEPGYQTIELAPSWEPLSPNDLGISADTRTLFLAFTQIMTMPSPTLEH